MTNASRSPFQFGRRLAAFAAICAAFAVSTFPARANIIDEWTSVTAPPAPALQSIAVDRATTALLLLDFVKQTCGGPRCMAAVPGVTKLLQAARAHRVPVVYSVTLAAAIGDTLPALAPITGDPSVQGTPDKFLNTDLQQILTRMGVKTVIVCGVSANGAVLYTASHAALAGLNVVVPVDGAPADTAYAEQFSMWELANAPRISANVKLTTVDRIAF
jgi:nicotinamidase-related amidase